MNVIITIAILTALLLVTTALVTTTQQQIAYATHAPFNLSYQDLNGGGDGSQPPLQCFPNGDARIVFSLHNANVPLDGLATVLVDGEDAEGDPVPVTHGTGSNPPVFGIVPTGPHVVSVLVTSIDGTQAIESSPRLPVDYTANCPPEEPEPEPCPDGQPRDEEGNCPEPEPEPEVPLNERFPDQGSCISEANNNPDAGFTKDDCKTAFKRTR